MAEFLNPNGNKVKTDNLSQFCRENGLKYDSMLKLHLGYKFTNYGWQSLHPKARRRRKRPAIVNINTMERYEVKNLKETAARLNLDVCNLSTFLQGRKPMYKHFVLEKCLNLINNYCPSFAA